MGSLQAGVGSENISPVLFIDLDNTLYPLSSGIDQLMVERIQRYCIEVLGMDPDEAARLHRKYFQDYGLAIRGLLKHHKIDPVHYDKFVDGGLPLDGLLVPDLELRNMILSLPPWPRFIFTNAGINHAERVIRLLGLSDVFKRDKIIYCDYGDRNFVCKPNQAAFIRAMKYAGVQNSFQCALVDDSIANVTSAIQMGWKGILVREKPKNIDTPGSDTIPTISRLHELPSVLHRIHTRVEQPPSGVFSSPAPIDISRSVSTLQTSVTDETLPPTPKDRT